MQELFYQTIGGRRVRVLFAEHDPIEARERLRGANHRWIFRRVQSRQPRRIAKGGKR